MPDEFYQDDEEENNFSRTTCDELSSAAETNKKVITKREIFEGLAFCIAIDHGRPHFAARGEIEEVRIILTAEDLDFTLNAGELFSLVVYGQLIIENAKIYKISDHLLDQIFDFMVRDFSRFALQMHSKQSSTEKQQEILLRMIMKPNVDKERYEAIMNEVYALNGRYDMKK